MGRIAFRIYLVAIGLVVVIVATSISSPIVSLDAFIAALIIFGPWLGGCIIGWLWGRSRFGLAAALTLGLFLIAATLAAFLFAMGSSQENACGEDECLQYFGRWIDSSLAHQWSVYALIAWMFSVAVFSRRRSRAATLEAASPPRRG